MTFNVDKCHVLTVSRNRKQIVIEYSLHGHVLENIKKAMYLCVELTKDLSWGPRVHTVTAKVNRTSTFTYQNLRGSPILDQTKCYSSIVHPILEYTAPLWDPHQKRLWDKLETVQRRAAHHICTDLSHMSSASALVKEKYPNPMKFCCASYKLH